MGGKSKKQTVGYKYYLGMHQVLCHGPCDAVTRFRVAERTAWSGTATGGAIAVSAPDLFGGDKREGGVSGTIDIDMGDSTQMPNDYLVTQLGDTVPGYRGVLSAIFRQFYFGNNPYLKAIDFRVQRVYVRQDGVDQWYPGKAGIVGSAGVLSLGAAQALNIEANSFTAANTSSGGLTISCSPSDAMVITKPLVADSGGLLTWNGWSAWPTDGATVPPPPVVGRVWDDRFLVYASNGGSESLIYTAPLDPNLYATEADAYAAVSALLPLTFTGYSHYRVTCVTDPNLGDNRNGLSLLVQSGSYDHVDMNPAHIIRECLTDPDWGMGYQEADIDDTSFTAAADTLYSEGFGMSLLWDKQITIEAFISEIIKHIDAVLYVSRTTGKFVLKLVRNDYDEGSLLLFDESNIVKVANPSRPGFGELYNTVTVNFWDSTTGKDASLSVSDTAMVQQQGQVIGTTVQYPGFSNGRNATIAGQRDLRSLSSPLFSCTIYANQDAKDLNIGEVIKFSWGQWQISEMVMRITGLAFGDGRNNQVRITCCEDVFATPETVVITEPGSGSGWEDPSGTPEDLQYRLALEMPYYEMVQSLGQATTDSTLANNPEAGYVMAAAVKPSAVINATMWTDDGSGYEEVGVLDFCPSGLLTASMSKTTTSVTLTGGTELDLVTTASHVQIEDELCRIDSFDIDTGIMTLGRGVLDTVPEEHLASSRFFFWDFYSGTDPTEYVDGETINVKLLPVSGAGTLAIADATAESVIMDQRAYRPYPPGDLQIEAERYGIGSYSGELSIAWVGRDRLQQTSGTLYDHTYGNIGPEAGTTYRVRVYVNGVLDHTEEPATSPFLYTPTGEGFARIEVHSKRDGLYSMQGANHSFIYTHGGARITEASEFCITEDGYYRVTED